MTGIERIIVDFAVEHSPPGSGWVYLALADHWDTVQNCLVLVLTAIIVGSLAFVVEAYS